MKVRRRTSLTVIFRWRQKKESLRSNANGKLLIIDGGFSKGISAKDRDYRIYADLILMVWCLRREPFESVEKAAVDHGSDIVSHTVLGAARSCGEKRLPIQISEKV